MEELLVCLTIHKFVHTKCFVCKDRFEVFGEVLTPIANLVTETWNPAVDQPWLFLPAVRNLKQKDDWLIYGLIYSLTELLPNWGPNVIKVIQVLADRISRVNIKRGKPHHAVVHVNEIWQSAAILGWGQTDTILKDYVTSVVLLQNFMHILHLPLAINLINLKR